jgi:hypothetical protein
MRSIQGYPTRCLLGLLGAAAPLQDVFDMLGPVLVSQAGTSEAHLPGPAAVAVHDRRRLGPGVRAQAGPSATASAPASEEIRYGTSAFPARRSYLVVTGRRRWMAEDPCDGELERLLAERGGHLLCL